MDDLDTMAREFLAAEYEADAPESMTAERLRSGLPVMWWADDLALRAIRAALLAAPPGYVLVDRAQLGAALDAVRSTMEAAYHRRFPECCGSYSPAGCCGNPREAWSEDDRATMDTLHPVEQALSAILAAAPEVK